MSASTIQAKLGYAMLEPVKHILSKQRIILASGSPRRQDLLREVGLKFEVIPSLYEEDLDPYKFDCPSKYVLETAQNKVLEVANRLKEDPRPPNLIIGADTTVSIDGKIYGKPNTPENAIKMLTELNGKAHSVFTGVVLMTGTDTVKFVERSEVYIAKLDAETIKGYVATKEPLDKAGGYGIQGLGGSLIEKIEGDYYNVVGLPLHSVCQHIIDLLKTNF